MKRFHCLLALALQGCGATLTTTTTVPPLEVVIRPSAPPTRTDLGQGIGAAIGTVVADAGQQIGKALRDLSDYPGEASVRKQYYVFGPQVVDVTVQNRSGAEARLYVVLLFMQGQRRVGKQVLPGPVRVRAGDSHHEVLDAPALSFTKVLAYASTRPPAP